MVEERTTVMNARTQAFENRVLIIGSLYWDDRRQAWRKSRLKMRFMTRPRQSATAGCRPAASIHTRWCFQPRRVRGAKIVRCYQDIRNPDDLDAEPNRAVGGGTQGKSRWLDSIGLGCVALLCNPTSEVPTEFTAAWAARVGALAGYGASRTRPERRRRSAPKACCRCRGRLSRAPMTTFHSTC
jgi:hypothetical protein